MDLKKEEMVATENIHYRRKTIKHLHSHTIGMHWCPKCCHHHHQIICRYAMYEDEYFACGTLIPSKCSIQQVEFTRLYKCQPNLGNDVDICGLIDPPSLVKWNCNPRLDKLYTLFFVDLYPLGIKSAPLLQFGILWWIVDIPQCDITHGTTLYEYQPPLPLYGTGKNRYAFALFEQPPYSIVWSEEQVVRST